MAMLQAQLGGGCKRSWAAAASVAGRSGNGCKHSQDNFAASKGKVQACNAASIASSWESFRGT